MHTAQTSIAHACIMWHMQLEAVREVFSMVRCWACMLLTRDAWRSTKQTMLLQPGRRPHC